MQTQNGHSGAESEIVPVRQPAGLLPSIATTAFSVIQHKQQISFLKEHIKENLTEGIHYGYAHFQLEKDGKPKDGAKKCLLKSGAEQLFLIFRLTPRLHITKVDLPDGHREYEILTEAVSPETGIVWGSGVGSCTTMESKYRYRNGERRCPACGKEGVRKSKKEGRDGSPPGWYCWEKMGGCGETFTHDDPEIIHQVVGKAPHDNPADYYNTVLKMAKKRSLVDAALSTTGASDTFTQDLDEGSGDDDEPKKTTSEAKRQDAQKRSEPRKTQTPPQNDPRPETLRAGSHKVVTDEEMNNILPPELQDGSEPEKLPEPLLNPWMHRIEMRKEISDGAKGRFLWEASLRWIENMTKPAMRNRLSLADRANIVAAMARPDLKEAARQAYYDSIEDDSAGQSQDDSDEQAA